MIHEIPLTGCAPTPLAHYLKALGILRLVAEQKDEDATGRWEGEKFILRSRLDRIALERFFLEEYCPSPIVAPWNGGSGFYPNDNKEGVNPLGVTQALRFQHYAQVIALGREIVAERKLRESPKNEEKADFLGAVRARLPEFALAWFDAAVMLGIEKPDYPPLLGTGGNDGRLDFTNNFMQRLVELFSTETGNPVPQSVPLLCGAIYGSPTRGLQSRAIGQFSPGSAGGPNVTSGFGTASLINSWDFVLMIEGALLFAGAATRRLESHAPSSLSYPFTVRATGAGSGNGATTDETQARAEIWLPLWSSWTTFDELRALFSEGRTTLGRRPTKDGLDFARALAGLGVDRGISGFQRYAFLMRSGKAYLATPLARVRVRRNPKVDLISELDAENWLERWRRFARDDNSPSRLRQFARRLEDALFSLTQSGDHELLQNILCLLGSIERSCAASAKAREVVPPVPRLSEAWCLQADDQSDEYRIACALAGLYAPGMPMRAHLVPVAFDYGKVCWSSSSRLAVWGDGALVNNLVRVIECRVLEAERRGHGDKPFDGHARADLAAVMAFMHGTTDDARIARLLGGLACVRLPEHMPRRDMAPDFIPAAFSVLKPLFVTNSLLRWLDVLHGDAHLPLPQQLVSLLRAGDDSQTRRAIELAMRRLRIAGIAVPAHPRVAPAADGLNSARLLCALMVPLEPHDVARVCRRVAPKNDEQTA